MAVRGAAAQKGLGQLRNYVYCPGSRIVGESDREVVAERRREDALQQLGVCRRESSHAREDSH